MTLVGRHEADRTMPMLCVVPMDEARHPGARGIDAGEAMRRPGDLYLQFRNSASETGLSSDIRGGLERNPAGVKRGPDKLRGKTEF